MRQEGGLGDELSPCLRAERVHSGMEGDWQGGQMRPRDRKAERKGNRAATGQWTSRARI